MTLLRRFRGDPRQRPQHIAQPDTVHPDWVDFARECSFYYPLSAGTAGNIPPGPGRAWALSNGLPKLAGRIDRWEPMATPFGWCRGHASTISFIDGDGFPYTPPRLDRFQFVAHFRYRGTNNGNASCVMSAVDGSGNYNGAHFNGYGHLMRGASDTAWACRIYYDGGSTDLATATATVVDKWAMFAGSWVSGGPIKMRVFDMLTGRLLGSADSSDITGTLDTADQIRLGYGYLQRSLLGDMVSAYASSCVLSDEQLQDLAVRPFLPVVAVQRVPAARVPTAAGPTYTLTADAGAFSVAGTAATIRARRRVDAEAGAVAWAGSDAALRVHREILAESGAFTWAGQDAALRVHRELLAESGAFTWAGTAATMRARRQLAAAAGAFVWAGTDAVMRARRQLAADAGAFTWSGTDATLRARRRLAADAGAYTWTGTDATLTHNPSGSTYTLDAESGAYVWTGTAAALRVHRELLASPGAFTWAGTAAVLRARRRLAADPGAFTWAGQDAALRVHRELLAGAGAFVWTGQDVTLRRSKAPLNAEPGAFVWAGQDATLRVHRELLAEPGAITWTGTDASLTYNAAAAAQAYVYADEHADVYADLLENGAAVTWVKEDRTYDPLTNASGSIPESSVAGVQMRVPGSPRSYTGLGLAEHEAATFLFAATTYLQVPALDSICTWQGLRYRLKSLDTVAPDGGVIFARVIAVLEGSDDQDLSAYDFAFAGEHADAYADVLDAGEALTFTDSARTSTPTTNAGSIVDTSVAGAALQVKGDREEYARLSLTHERARTLLFVATTYGEKPKMGARCTWQGVEYVVRSVRPLAPDGAHILSRVVIGP